MMRRFFLLSVLACCAAACCLTTGRESLATPPREQPSLKEILKNDLHAPLPRQVAFIDRVVYLVDIGRLPRELVMGTYDWARHENAEFPFPYFEFALRARARQIGVSL